MALDDIFEARRVDGNTVYGKFADREAIRAYSSDVPPGTRFVTSIQSPRAAGESVVTGV